MLEPECRLVTPVGVSSVVGQACVQVLDVAIVPSSRTCFETAEAGWYCQPTAAIDTAIRSRSERLATGTERYHFGRRSRLQLGVEPRRGHSMLWDCQQILTIRQQHRRPRQECLRHERAAAVIGRKARSDFLN